MTKENNTTVSLYDIVFNNDRHKNIDFALIYKKADRIIYETYGRLLNRVNLYIHELKDKTKDELHSKLMQAREHQNPTSISTILAISYLYPDLIDKKLIEACLDRIDIVYGDIKIKERQAKPTTMTFREPYAIEGFADVFSSLIAGYSVALPQIKEIEGTEVKTEEGNKLSKEISLLKPNIIYASRGEWLTLDLGSLDRKALNSITKPIIVGEEPCHNEVEFLNSKIARLRRGHKLHTPKFSQLYGHNEVGDILYKDGEIGKNERFPHVDLAIKDSDGKVISENAMGRWVCKKNDESKWHNTSFYGYTGTPENMEYPVSLEDEDFIKNYVRKLVEKDTNNVFSCNVTIKDGYIVVHLIPEIGVSTNPIHIIQKSVKLLHEKLPYDIANRILFNIRDRYKYYPLDCEGKVDSISLQNEGLEGAIAAEIDGDGHITIVNAQEYTDTYELYVINKIIKLVQKLAGDDFMELPSYSNLDDIKITLYPKVYHTKDILIKVKMLWSKLPIEIRENVEFGVRIGTVRFPIAQDGSLITSNDKEKTQDSGESFTMSPQNNTDKR